MLKYFVFCTLAFGLVACTETTTPVTNIQDETSESHQNSGLWKRLNEEGLRSLSSIKLMSSDSPDLNETVCENGLHRDSNTIYFDELERIYQEGTLVEGVCGNAINLASGEVAPLSINMVSNMDKGTVEFWFKPNANFYKDSARTLLGNNQARVHFFVKDSSIIFQKNVTGKHQYVKGIHYLTNDWTHIAGQWDGKTVSLWVNDEKVAQEDYAFGYEYSTDNDQPYENLLVIGYKSKCCMEAPGQIDALTTSGSYDQIRVSNITRYK